LLTVFEAWFAARPFRMGLWFFHGMRRGLTLALRVLPLEPLNFPIFFLDLLLRLIQILLGNKLDWARPSPALSLICG